MPRIRRIFGTDGIRGAANEFPITPDVALKVGQALAVCLRESGHDQPVVLIGKDTRVSGYMLETALTSGLVSQGAEVLLAGALPTPAVARLTKTMMASAGIMITASHNPHTDNGYKFFDALGFKMPDSVETRLENMLFGEIPLPPPPATDGLGRATRIADAAGRYIESVKNAVGYRRLHGLKLVVDCAHGAAFQIAPTIFRELGAEVVPVGVTPTGININEDCGATTPGAAAELVRIHEADLGISFDGDADRVVITAPDGRPIPGDTLITLCALDLHRRGLLRGAKIAVNAQSSRSLSKHLAKAGIEVLTTPVGDRHVIAAMRRENLTFGAENCGHVIFGDHATTGDGILTALHFLNLLIDSGKTVRELTSAIPEFPQEMRNVQVSARVPLETLTRLNVCIASAEAEFGESGRVLVRYSETENKLRLLVEHQDAEVARDWIARLEEAARADLKL